MDRRVKKEASAVYFFSMSIISVLESIDRAFTTSDGKLLLGYLDVDGPATLLLQRSMSCPVAPS